MRKYGLKPGTQILIEGKTIWNKKKNVALVIEPTGRHDDSIVFVDKNGKDRDLNPSLFTVLTGGRNVALDNYMLEIEHALFIHMLGVRNVRIRLSGSRRLPFMCSQELWEKLKPLLVRTGDLEPWCPPSPTECIDEPVRDHIHRHTMYKVSDSDDLILRAFVDYRTGITGFAELRIPVKGPLPVQQIDRMVSARTLGKPPIVYPFAWFADRILNWPHMEKILWKGRHPTKEELDELAWHKLNDGSLVTLGAPKGFYPAGVFEFHLSPHGPDVAVSQSLAMYGRVASLQKKGHIRLG